MMILLLRLQLLDLEAAISIIRLSGKDCIAFVQEFFYW